MAANPLDFDPRPAPETPPKHVARSSVATIIIAIVAVAAALYYAKIVLIVVFVSMLVAFVLDPVTRMFEHFRLPRALAALLSVLLLMAALYGLGYVSYNRGAAFMHELPRYSKKIEQFTAKFRQKAQTIQKSTESVTGTNHQNTVKVKQESSWIDTLFSNLGTATEIIFAASFVPFLAYFMLTWSEHSRRCTVLLFPYEMRSTAYATLTAITDMIRGFIIGNLLIGIFIGTISTAIFGLLGLPYFYFIGFISGFLSLVPYLGVLLAAVPPFLSGLGHIHATEAVVIIVTVFGLHLFSLNVLYPKFLGRRLQLNPLTVTIALLFWGWIWGAIGLILAIPMTAACKIVCDHVEKLRPLGAWLGE